MALKKFIICPYAIGNIDFCIDGETCLQPKYSFNSIFNAILKALAMEEAQKKKIIQQGFEMSQNHTLEEERKSILQLLDQVDDIWNQKDLFQF